MATDKNGYHQLQEEIAGSKNTPKELILKLMKDRHSKLKCSLSSNPNIPIEYLNDIVHSNDDSDYYCLKYIIGNPSAPAELKSEAFDRWISDASSNESRFVELSQFIWRLTGAEEWLTDDHINELVNIPMDHISKPNPNVPWSNDWRSIFTKNTKSLVDKYNENK